MIIWKRNRESNSSWRKNIKRFHLNVSYESTFRSIKFSSQVSENTIKCNESTFWSSQQLVLKSVSQSAISANIRRFVCVNRQSLSLNISKKQTKSSVHSTISASNAKFSAFHREKRLINGFSQQTIINVHLAVSRSNAAVWQSDNFVSALDDLSIGCSSSDYRQNRQCIWSFKVGCSSLTTDNFVSASDRSGSDAVIWHQQTTSSVHLIVWNQMQQSDINRQFRQCIWSFEIRCSFSDIRQHRQCI